MSEPNPCLSCGACCAHFRVSFYWGECASAGGPVPDELVVQVAPNRVAMIGTESKPCRCVGLQGEVGKAVSCGMYEQRSSTCREFDASWYDGQHNGHCDTARAAYGLPPLVPASGLIAAVQIESVSAIA
ncbi:YkgJ family cysteine cluster protein [Pseudomonas sp. R5(2019)]|uniref:YkgJ family cysteine cluster protein n=1 Tax=Pseudomonas sp. R5(2019) TaxID=2697566 RepID=UPI0014121F36|nr:YkgJ family cysteine cluster protein [Pseudomonas sp. R5(2019)]NBA95643.1 YkgJ family cysteine cluster protein [Pseudomonas sp. R5(2019)]